MMMMKLLLLNGCQRYVYTTTTTTHDFKIHMKLNQNGAFVVMTHFPYMCVCVNILNFNFV